MAEAIEKKKTKTEMGWSFFSTHNPFPFHYNTYIPHTKTLTKLQNYESHI